MRRLPLYFLYVFRVPALWSLYAQDMLRLVHGVSLQMPDLQQKRGQHGAAVAKAGPRYQGSTDARVFCADDSIGALQRLFCQIIRRLPLAWEKVHDLRFVQHG